MIKVNIKDMTLEQKIGQILMVGFHSLQFDDHVRELLYEHYIGNIILFSRNVADKDQIANLTEEIQKNAIQATGIPAFISIDQEGGMVTRITNGVTVFPGNMAVAATDDPRNAYNIGEIMGKELRALGIKRFYHAFAYDSRDNLKISKLNKDPAYGAVRIALNYL